MGRQGGLKYTGCIFVRRDTSDSCGHLRNAATDHAAGNICELKTWRVVGMGISAIKGVRRCE